MERTRAGRVVALAAAALLATITMPAQAAIITFNWQATVAGNVLGAPFAAGDTISGSFSFDNSVPASGGDGTTTATYGNAMRSITINGLGTIQWTDAGVSANSIRIDDGFNVSGALQRDLFQAILGGITIEMGRQANGFNPGCIGSLSLPSAPYDGGCFNYQRLVYDSATVKFRADFTGMTTSVPEPTSVALLGLGLVGVGFLRRRRKA